MGDFNARIGNRTEGYEKVRIGKRTAMGNVYWTLVLV